MTNEQKEKQFDDSFSDDEPKKSAEKQKTKKVAHEQLDKLKAEIQPPPESNDDEKNTGQSSQSSSGSRFVTWSRYFDSSLHDEPLVFIIDACPLYVLISSCQIGSIF